jgi:deazaflavin-dependent oxidoreductase (nitroreductase family)
MQVVKVRHVGQQIKLPSWVKPASRVNKWLLRLGLLIGTQHILAVRGRRSGKLRSTPVSLLRVGGRRYIVSAPTVNWVRNARAAGRGTLTRGRREEAVRFTPLPPGDRAAIVREFPRQVPHGVQVFGLPPDPDAFEAAADRLEVIRIDSDVTAAHLT